MSSETIVDSAVRLNIGAGDRPIEGFVNIDRKTGQEAYPLASPDNHWDEIRASHVLEHLPPEHTEAAIADWARALKPGGRLRVAVPDFDYWSRAYLEGKRSDVASHIMGGHTGPDDVHHSLFDAHTLRTYFQRAGLVCVQRWTDGYGDCASNEGSLNLEAYKPTMDVAEFGRVRNLRAVLSTGRIVFSDFMVSAYETLGSLGVPMMIQQGGHWGQRMEQGIEAAIADGAEWILTLDYDSVWDARALQRLCLLAESHPEVDAVVPVQAKRECNKALFNGVAKHVKSWAEFDQELVDIEMGHFGTTLLRASAFAKMPKPWFEHVPDANGAWNDGKCDDDVNFWRKWRAVGNRVCLAPRVSIGHCQMVVTWCGESLDVFHQFISDYRQNGVPERARR